MGWISDNICVPTKPVLCITAWGTWRGAIITKATCFWTFVFSPFFGTFTLVFPFLACFSFSCVFTNASTNATCFWTFICSPFFGTFPLIFPFQACFSFYCIFTIFSTDVTSFGTFFCCPFFWTFAFLEPFFALFGCSWILAACKSAWLYQYLELKSSKSKTVHFNIEKRI